MHELWLPVRPWIVDADSWPLCQDLLPGFANQAIGRLFQGFCDLADGDEGGGDGARLDTAKMRVADTDDVRELALLEARPVAMQGDDLAERSLHELGLRQLHFFVVSMCIHI